MLSMSTYVETTTAVHELDKLVLFEVTIGQV
jgi:hypothetical protein